MTLKEFKKVLKENKELYEKFKNAKKEFKFEEGKEAEEMSKIVSELGYDVPVSEFALEKIEKQKLNDEELKSVAGGLAQESIFDDTNNKKKRHTDGCIYNFSDTNCELQDYCDMDNVFYKVRPDCKYDYHDTDCLVKDYCDGIFGGVITG